MISEINFSTDEDEIKNGTAVVIIPSKADIPFPGKFISINTKSLNLNRIIEDANDSQNYVVLLAQRDDNAEYTKAESYYRVGAIGKVNELFQIPGIGLKAIGIPEKRVKIKKFIVSNETLYGIIELCEIEEKKSSIINATFRIIKNLYKDYLDNKKNNNSRVENLSFVDTGNGLEFLDSVVSDLNISLDKKQKLLEENDFEKYVSDLHVILVHEIEFLRLEKKIESKVSLKIMNDQKEYFLREKIKGLKSEISNNEADVAEVDTIQDLIKKDALTDDAKEKALAEIDKLKKLHSMSPEFGLIRDYLSVICSLPWKNSSKSDLDIGIAEKILNEDHYGLDKAKERIIEYLAVLKLVNQIKGTIICLVGPPGVGKTSLGRSIARATGREYIRIALGGIHDEAEIRGHRKTYIGAMPGKIIKSLKKVKVNNPLILLDEIDKISSDFRGDPASALLEVLDPEQNNSFVDNYLDIEFDLSNVMFITTANDKFKIPQPLYDRMEIIELDGYLDVEKYHIAYRYLLKKEMKMNGLKEHNLKITNQALYKIISDYTMEAGVRELERQIAKICRKVARKVTIDTNIEVVVTPNNLDEFLGVRKYLHEKVSDEKKIGEVSGLAWTASGGTVLKVETNIMDGNGKLNLTGKLGDVMKESAQAALSYIRTNCKDFDIEPSLFEKIEVHLHFPEGAVPKDGPSAGITIITSLLSALKKIPVSQNLGMTGEVTIHGDVLAIGGLNAKLMAAKRAGIKKVLIPENNKQDLTEIADEITSSLEIVSVKHISEVLKIALGLTNGK